MTETEAKWAARVTEWRASGRTAPEFCVGKGFKPGGLRYWASRLGMPADGGAAAPKPPARIARVVRAATPAPVHETLILIEIGHARLGVRRGFDAETLRAVLGVLGGER
jgi:hypothetical protein